MSIAYYTTNSLIASIKRRAMLPSNQKTFQTDDFLAFINEELMIGIIPSLMSVHEEYFVTDEDVLLVPNKSSYNIPKRAIGSKLRDIFYKDTSGNLYDMTRIQPEDVAIFQGDNTGYNYRTFLIKGNDVVLVPSVGPSPVGYLNFQYFLRPNKLVEESRISVIQSITENIDDTTTYVVNTVPTGMTTATKLDILQTEGGHKTRKIDITPISVTGVSITFDNSELPSGIEVGDHIAFAGECIIPQIPDELHPFLAQRVAAKCLEAMGDGNGLAAANTKLSEMEIKSSVLVDSRVDGAPQKISNYNSILRKNRIRHYGR